MNQLAVMAEKHKADLEVLEHARRIITTRVARLGDTHAVICSLSLACMMDDIRLSMEELKEQHAAAVAALSTAEAKQLRISDN